MAIQVRRGLKADFDPTKLLPGEWAVSIDSATSNQMVWMCFAPGVVKQIGTYEDFRTMIQEIFKDGVNVSDEQIAQAVEDYLAEHPVQSGATAEQVAQIEQNKTNINQLSEHKVDKDGESQVSPINCTFFDITKSANRWNPQKQTVGEAVDASGNIVTTEGYVLSDFIPVTAKYIYFARKTLSNPEWLERDMYTMSKYDENKNFIERIKSAPSGSNVTGVAYVRVSSAYAEGWAGCVAFSDSETFAGFDDYSVTGTLKPTYLPVDNPFAGLSAVAFGTSLTARAEEDHKYDYTTHGYLTYLRQYSGMTIDNQGIGGATILSDSATKSIYTTIAGYADYASKQVCIIEGFFNDWFKNAVNTLGQHTDTGNDTVCGRVRNAIVHIMGQNPNITIFAVFDHYGKYNSDIDASSNVVLNGYTQYQYYSEIIKVCESLGVVCIKECATSGIGELAPQYLDDYIHLNDLGAKQSAMTIWNEMRQHCPKLID